MVLDDAYYERSRDRVRSFWEQKLGQGGLIVVPEQRVLDAERNLLIQNLGLTWRYSVGNRYEQLSTPEAIDVARVLAEYGQLPVSRTSCRRPCASSRSTRCISPSGGRTGGSACGSSGSRATSGSPATATRSRGRRRRSGATCSTSRASSVRVGTGYCRASASPQTSATASTGCTRRRSSGKGSATWRAYGARRAIPASPRRRRVSRRSSSEGCGARCGDRSERYPAARCSSRCGCSSTSRPTAR